MTWSRAIPSSFKEAPALCKFKGRYYLITSGTTGWSPNPASYSVADNILGCWEAVSNPCRGIGSELTFGSQGTFILPAPGRTDGSFIFMADRWIEAAINTSIYVWLPFRIGPNGDIVLENYDRWSLGIFDSKATSLPAPVVRSESLANGIRLQWHPVPGAAGYRILRNNTPCGFTCSTEFDAVGGTPGTEGRYAVVACTLGVSSAASNPVSATASLP